MPVQHGFERGSPKFVGPGHDTRVRHLAVIVEGHLEHHVTLNVAFCCAVRVFGHVTMQEVLSALEHLYRPGAGGALDALSLEWECPDGQRDGESQRRGAGGERSDEAACRHGGLLKNPGDAPLQQATPEEC